MVKRRPLAMPELGSCACSGSGRAWRLRAAGHSQGEKPEPLGAQAVPPVPPVLERAEPPPTSLSTSPMSLPSDRAGAHARRDPACGGVRRRALPRQ